MPRVCLHCVLVKPFIDVCPSAEVSLLEMFSSLSHVDDWAGGPRPELITRKAHAAIQLLAYCCPASELAEQRLTEPFVMTLASLYLSPHYHNFHHAFDVFGACFTFLIKYGASQLLEENDRAALLVAALAHDTGHDGCNNAFQKSAQTDMVRTYGEVSTLEHMHFAHLHTVMSASGFSPEIQAKLLSQCKPLIISTDMAQHKAGVAEIEAVAEEGYDKENTQHRMTLVAALLHAADLGHTAQPFCTHQQWVRQMVKERCEQNETLAALGLPCKEACAFEDAMKNIASGQHGFLLQVVDPLFSAIACIIPVFGELRDNVRCNAEAWKCYQQ